MLQFSSSQFSNLRWRYFVESLLLKSTPNVSSVVLSSARVAGVDRADARASSVAREPPRGFKAFSAARASLGTKLHRWPGRARREVFAARSRLDSPCAGRFCLGVANETVTL